jgi:hypothetical protein
MNKLRITKGMSEAPAFQAICHFIADDKNNSDIQIKIGIKYFSHEKIDELRADTASSKIHPRWLQGFAIGHQVGQECSSKSSAPAPSWITAFRNAATASNLAQATFREQIRDAVIESINDDSRLAKISALIGGRVFRASTLKNWRYNKKNIPTEKNVPTDVLPAFLIGFYVAQCGGLDSEVQAPSGTTPATIRGPFQRVSPNAVSPLMDEFPLHTVSRTSILLDDPAIRLRREDSEQTSPGGSLIKETPCHVRGIRERCAQDVETTCLSAHQMWNILSLDKNEGDPIAFICRIWRLWTKVTVLTEEPGSLLAHSCMFDLSQLPAKEPVPFEYGPLPSSLKGYEFRIRPEGRWQGTGVVPSGPISDTEKKGGTFKLEWNESQEIGRMLGLSFLAEISNSEEATDGSCETTGASIGYTCQLPWYIETDPDRVEYFGTQTWVPCAEAHFILALHPSAVNVRPDDALLKVVDFAAPPHQSPGEYMRARLASRDDYHSRFNSTWTRHRAQSKKINRNDFRNLHIPKELESLPNGTALSDELFKNKTVFHAKLNYPNALKNIGVFWNAR